MQLETTRLLIRDFIESDLDAVYAYGSDPEVVRYMAFPRSTLAGTREHIARCMALAAVAAPLPQHAIACTTIRWQHVRRHACIVAAPPVLY